MASNLNEAGRGINCVVVNPDTKEVVRVARFDTFASGLLHIIVLHYICSNAVKNITIMAVSYTHLTLPTIYSV